MLLSLLLVDVSDLFVGRGLLRLHSSLSEQHCGCVPVEEDAKMALEVKNITTSCKGGIFIF